MFESFISNEINHFYLYTHDVIVYFQGFATQRFLM